MEGESQHATWLNTITGGKGFIAANIQMPERATLNRIENRVQRLIYISDEPNQKSK